MKPLLFSTLCCLVFSGCWMPYHFHPITKAAANGNVRRVERYLKRDPSCVDKRARLGESALWYSLYDKDSKLLKTLLDTGANISLRYLMFVREYDGTVSGGATPLHLAASTGFCEGIRLLLNQGASLAAKDDKGRTPFEVAVAFGHQEAATLLKVEVKVEVDEE